MAIASINEMVHQRLSCLNNTTDNTLIDSITIQQFYFMQGQTLKTDADVETESNYKPLEKILFAALVSYNMLKKRIMENMAGSGGSSTVTPGKIVKKAKADVVEAEFEIPKASDGIFLNMNATQVLAELVKEICSTAYMLHYCIPEICEEYPADVIPPFKVYRQDC